MGRIYDGELFNGGQKEKVSLLKGKRVMKERA